MANPTTISLGLGTISIDGTDMGILVGDVTYQQELETVDYETGTPLVASSRLVARARARLTATAAEMSSAALSLLFPAVSSAMTSHAVTFTHPRPSGDSITVTFASATISARGSVRFSPETFTATSIEIESLGALPSITITGGTP